MLVAIFIVVSDSVIRCVLLPGIITGGSVLCNTAGLPAFNALLAAGTVELVFEALGVLRIFKQKKETKHHV